MHWRTPFPPKRPSVLADLIAVLKKSLAPAEVMAPKPADEPPASEPAKAPVADC